MKILDKKSLYITVDNFNESHFYGQSITLNEAVRTIKWIQTRSDTKYSYAKGFGITEYDMKTNVYLFNGDKILTHASLRHIMAEEAGRTVRLLNKKIKTEIPELKIYENNLRKGIDHSENQGYPEGWFCCAPCTVALWRYMIAGGLKIYSNKLYKGLKILKTFRDGNGEWKRFPWYYLLLLLSELNHPLSKAEIKYSLKLSEKRLNTIKTQTKFSERRKDLLSKILDNN